MINQFSIGGNEAKDGESTSGNNNKDNGEKNKMKQKVDKILAHKMDCFINRQLIYNYPESLFAAAGVMAVAHADFDGIERLSAVLGGGFWLSRFRFLASNFEAEVDIKLSCISVRLARLLEDCDC